MLWMKNRWSHVSHLNHTQHNDKCLEKEIRIKYLLKDYGPPDALLLAMMPSRSSSTSLSEEALSPSRSSETSSGAQQNTQKQELREHELPRQQQHDQRDVVSNRSVSSSPCSEKCSSHSRSRGSDAVQAQSCWQPVRERQSVAVELAREAAAKAAGAAKLLESARATAEQAKQAAAEARAAAIEAKEAAEEVDLAATAAAASISSLAAPDDGCSNGELSDPEMCQSPDAKGRHSTVRVGPSIKHSGSSLHLAMCCHFVLARQNSCSTACHNSFAEAGPGLGPCTAVIVQTPVVPESGRHVGVQCCWLTNACCQCFGNERGARGSSLDQARPARRDARTKN